MKGFTKILPGTTGLKVSHLTFRRIEDKDADEMLRLGVQGAPPHLVDDFKKMWAEQRTVQRAVIEVSNGWMVTLATQEPNEEGQCTQVRGNVHTPTYEVWAANMSGNTIGPLDFCPLTDVEELFAEVMAMNRITPDFVDENY